MVLMYDLLLPACICASLIVLLIRMYLNDSSGAASNSTSPTVDSAENQGLMRDKSEMQSGSFDDPIQGGVVQVKSSALDMCLNSLLLFFTCSALALSSHHYFFPSDDAISTVAIIPPPMITDYYEDEPETQEADPQIGKQENPQHKEADKEPDIDSESDHDHPKKIPETKHLTTKGPIVYYLRDSMKAHSKKSCDADFEAPHEVGPFFTANPNDWKVMLSSDHFEKKDKPWDYLTFRKAGDGTPGMKVGDRMYAVNDSNEVFHRHLIEMDISELSRPIYQWHGNKRFVDSVASDKDDHHAILKDREDLWTLAPGFSTKKLENPENYFLEGELSETTYVYSMITAKNAFAQEQLFSTCGHRVMNLENCGFPTHLSLPLRKRHIPHDRGIIVSQGYGYWHLVGEVIPRVAFFLDELLEDESIQIIVANTEPSYVIKWMEFLGINATRILRSRRVGHAYLLKEAWLTEATPCVFGRRWAMAKLQQHLQPHVRKYQTKQKKHILIARRVKGGDRRSIPNWDAMFGAIVAAFPDEVILAMTDHVGTLSPGGLSGYANAWMYLSIFGAGLVNMVLIPESAVIFEVTVWQRGLVYMRQALSLGHQYYGYTSEKHNFAVDPQEIVDVIQAFIHERDGTWPKTTEESNVKIDDSQSPDISTISTTSKADERGIFQNVLQGSGLNAGHQKKFFENTEKITKFSSSSLEQKVLVANDRFGLILVPQNGDDILKKGFASTNIEEFEINSKEISSRGLIAFVRDPIEHFLHGWQECEFRRMGSTENKTSQELDAWFEENKKEGPFPRHVSFWLEEVKAQSNSCKGFSNPQTHFLLGPKEKDSGSFAVLDNLNMIADLEELQSVLQTVGIAYDSSLNNNDNSVKDKYFPILTEDIGDKLMRDICDYVFLDYCLLDFQPPDTCGELVMEKCASVMDTT